MYKPCAIFSLVAALVAALSVYSFSSIPSPVSLVSAATNGLIALLGLAMTSVAFLKTRLAGSSFDQEQLRIHRAMIPMTRPLLEIEEALGRIEEKYPGWKLYNEFENAAAKYSEAEKAFDVYLQKPSTFKRTDIMFDLHLALGELRQITILSAFTRVSVGMPQDQRISENDANSAWQLVELTDQVNDRVRLYLMTAWFLSFGFIVALIATGFFIVLGGFLIVANPANLPLLMLASAQLALLTYLISWFIQLVVGIAWH